MRFFHREGFATLIDHKQDVWHPAHLFNAAQTAFELKELTGQHGDFFFREAFKVAVIAHVFEFAQLVNAGTNNLEVGERTAEPATVNKEGSRTACLGFDEFGDLLFGAHKHDFFAPSRSVAHKGTGFIEQFGGLGQIDNIDAVALAPDIFAHFGVPAIGLVTEVNSGFHEFFQRAFGHYGGFLLYIEVGH